MLSALKAFGIGLLVICTGTLAQAQSTTPDYLDAVADCEHSNCHVRILFAVRRLKRSGIGDDELNSELATLAGALYESAVESERRVTSRRASIALLRLARFSTNSRQRRAFRLVARAILTGNDDLIDLDDPFAASPS